MCILKVLTNYGSISRLDEAKMIVQILIRTIKFCGLAKVLPKFHDGYQIFLLEKRVTLQGRKIGISRKPSLYL